MARTIVAAPDPYARERARLHDLNKTHHPVGVERFLGVDGEGITLPSGEHRYVLLGVGADQIENRKGLHWRDIFTFLYDHYQPRTAFAGFYLGYDFTQWIKTMPEGRARALLTIEGREGRRSKSPAMKGKFLPVDLEDWQVDMIGSKRMAIRYKPCDCLTVKCDHEKGKWLYICDTGPYFQTSFLNVIDPKNWAEPVVTPEEYATILEGKAARATAALDDDMRFYNRLENDVLARVLHDMDNGLRSLDVNLAASQYYGPGQAAQSWLKGRAPSGKDIRERVPEWFLDAARQSYFGGWFELTAHGPIPGTTYEYDINSAYPYIISQLPCLLHGVYSRGSGYPEITEEEVCLVRALVWGKPPHSDRARCQGLGAMLHRDNQGRISRPLATGGWYWWHELQAARKVGAVSALRADRIYEWVKYTPCDCKAPVWQIKNLYELRQQVGKKTSLGKGAKLVANSGYGKFAQSIGAPLFANPIYASLITAGCRTMILDAISTHPGGRSNVVMVATDAVFFLDPHPTLPQGPALGQWDELARENLTLFKPGVYWDDTAREALAKGDHPSFKARGVSARDFGSRIRDIDQQFSVWDGRPPAIGMDPGQQESLLAHGLPAWPKVRFRSSFAMVSALQALLRNDWSSAGTIQHNQDGGGKALVQNSDPGDKRRDVWYDTARGIYRSEPLAAGANAVYRHTGNPGEWDNIPVENYDTVPYEKRFGMEDPFSDENQQAFGISPDEHKPLLGAFRAITGKE